MVKFTARVWITGGGSAVLTVPHQYVKDGYIEVGEEYPVEVTTITKESDDQDQEQQE